MMKWNYIPLKSILFNLQNIIFPFITSRFSNPLPLITLGKYASIYLGYKEFKKSELSDNTQDDFINFHIFYNKDNLVEAVEIFKNDIEITFNEEIIFPVTINKIKEVFTSLEKEDDFHYLDKKNSIGIEIDDNECLTSMLFGKDGYYENTN